MYYVYIIRSIKYSNQTYIGFTENLDQRMNSHNQGHVPHTSKFKPWEIITTISFLDKKQALSFEKYLKSGSGRQFAYKHFFC